jgi:hypothetical protein
MIKSGERERAHRPTSSMRTEERILTRRRSRKVKESLKKKVEKKWG